MELTRKVIVITGGAGGLGLEMARAMQAHHANVVLIDIDQQRIDQAIAQLPGATGYAANLCDEAQVVDVFQRIVDACGAVDALINNAGVTNDGLLLKQREGDVTSLALSRFQSVLDVNLTGSFLCGREAAAHMVKAGVKGVIVNISSISRAGNVGQTSYSATKAAVVAMSTTWCKELARYGIRSVAIAPGFVRTEMTASMPPEILSRIEAQIPVNRMAQPAEIASGVLFALQNDYFNGRVLEIDGGLRL
ncbi:3-ketoacyl-ACP reductase [Arenicella chitinivorans]|uniref:3-ketoacyl-ACP reductase n=1 Tax=Arenicella chitinivorans TaxID=1329800 RepID=A0A918REU1_9GAMM|nr:SDR family NAD(P)-dependent oxidoreductase [Arenicella chitinivorans]GGZ96308.1 3-ketoacyl-ACP reductase [Arenicella chitinivorans]